jgi:hypothetical protein
MTDHRSLLGRTSVDGTDHGAPDDGEQTTGTRTTKGHSMTTSQHTRGAALVLAVSMAVAGCAPASEEEQIAGEACGLYAELVDGDIEAVFDTDLVERFEELEQRASEAGMSDAEIEAAVQEECPGTIADLEELFGEGF